MSRDNNNNNRRRHNGKVQEDLVAIVSWNSTSKQIVYLVEDLIHLRRRTGAAMGYKYYNSARDTYESPTSIEWVSASEAQRLIKTRRNRVVGLP
jgi:hypothetical protein